LLAGLFAPFYFGLLFGFDEPGLMLQLLAVVAMSGLLIYRHRQNISNLLAGKESRIGRNKK
jgi:glycerol-3-phosphate acyltransferase PlsY